MIRAVVFDFGGVLITPITNQLGTVAERHGRSVPEVLEVLLGPRDSGDHPWHRAERGELAVADIQGLLDPWAAAAGLTLAGDELDVLLAAGAYTHIRPVHDRIVTLRRDGIKTALLTNTFAEFRPTMERDVDFGLFDVVIESFAVGARKPEPAIYEATQAALGVAPGEIAYLDDFDQNLVPAAALGWTTIHVLDPVVALAELDALLAGDARDIPTDQYGDL